MNVVMNTIVDTLPTSFMNAANAIQELAGDYTLAALVSPVLTKFEAHQFTFYAAILFWTSLYLISGVALRALVPQYYDFVATPSPKAAASDAKKQLKIIRKRQQKWRMYCVSTVHAIVAVCLSVPLLNDPVLQHDKLFGYTDGAGTLMAISSAYFAWDIGITLLLNEEIAFVVHGVSCFAVYFMSFRPFLLYFGSVFLMFELSTPFMNISKVLYATQQMDYEIKKRHDPRSSSSSSSVGESKADSTTFQIVAYFFFALFFFGARIVFGLYQSYIFWDLMIRRYEECDLPLVLLFCTANIALNSLNLMWFPMIVRKPFEKKHKAL